MLDLLLTIACTTSIGVIIKLAETRVYERLTLLLFNYIVATLVSFGLFLISGGGDGGTGAIGHLSLSTFSLLMAPFAGFIFAFNFFLMILAIKKRGVALPVSLMRLSAIVPVAASLVFFDEAPTWLQVLGMLGALAAAVMMSVSFRGGEMIRSEGGESRIWLALTSLLLLFCFGLADLSMKLFERYGIMSEKPLFLSLLFAFAAISVGVPMIVKKIRIRWIDALWGVVLGVPNLFSSYFLVGALEDLPAYVVFPMVTAVTVMLIAIIARFAFGEAIGKVGVGGIILTLLSILAINL